MARIVAACFYSFNGLRAAVSKEAAFRQEAAGITVLCIILAVLPISLVWKGVLFLSTAGVLVAELLNSAIEAVVDLVSPEFHELAEQAKDMGSAAVFISIVISLTVWVCAVIDMLIAA